MHFLFIQFTVGIVEAGISLTDAQSGLHHCLCAGGPGQSSVRCLKSQTRVLTEVFGTDGVFSVYVSV